MRWRRRIRRSLASVRTRATLAAAVTVAGALVIAASTLVFLVHRAGVRSVRAAARDQLAAVLVLARTTPIPSLLPSGRNTALVQIIDGDGHVVASSSPHATIAMTRRRAAAGQRVTAEVGQLPTDDDGPFLVVGEQTAGGKGAMAYVASSLKTVDDTTYELERGVVIGGVLLLVLVAELTWLLTGRALRPVESMRTEVAYISDQRLSRRVPQPATDDEIGRLAATMNDMLERLEDSALRQRRFVADASHELRSPLASMMTQLDVAATHPEVTSRRELLATLRFEGERLQRIIDDLLLLARSDEGSLRTRQRLVDLDDVVLEEANRFRAGRGIEVNTTAVSVAQVHGDAGQLALVVRNLLDNAGRYASTAVTVELREDSGTAILLVADDGPGIGREDRERIFQRFTRLDDARGRRAGGSGLGLAIVARIVEVHDGTITVEDAPGGARLVARIPGVPLD